jgi:ATP-dependent DNA helicase RecG
VNPVAEIIKKGESERSVFLPPRTTMPTIGKTVCGMLNQQGGAVLWGVDQNGEPADIPDAEDKSQKLIEYLMRNLVQRPLLSVSVESYRGKCLVLIEVPASEDKPYSLEREIWVRVGQQNLRASTERSFQMVERRAIRSSRWGRDIVSGFELADCDRDELTDTRCEMAKSGRFGIEIPDEDEELLQRLYLLKSGQFTNASLVLFARDPLAWSPNLALRIISYAGAKQGKSLHEQTLHGPAIRVLKQAISVIQQQTGISGHFKTDQLEREDRPAYAVYALREALVNAMAHRDYEAVSGQLRVEIFPDHLMIQNPGTLPEGWTVRDIIRKEESHPPNPDIARVFHLRGLMERLGLGGRKLDEACRKLKAKPPVWKAESGVVSLTLFRAPRPETSTALHPRQEKFLRMTHGNATFKTADYSVSAGVSTRQARRDLAAMEELGRVRRYGKGPATVYKIVAGGGHE